MQNESYNRYRQYRCKDSGVKDKDIVEVFYDSNQTLENLPDICAKYAVEKAIAATVIDLNEQVSAQLARLPVPLLWLNETTSLPV